MARSRLTVSTFVIALALGGLGAVPAHAVTIQSLTGQSISSITDLPYTNRLLENATASSCADNPQKPYPGIGGTGTFYGDNFQRASFVDDPVCITVTVNATACSGGRRVLSSSYIPFFNGDATGYVGDQGDPSIASYSFVLPAGTQFQTVVQEESAGQGCDTYDIAWDSDRPWATLPPLSRGVPALGSTLTGIDATWAGSPSTTKSWVRCDATGGGCTEIPGATGATYAPTTADLGHTLRFRSSATANNLTSHSRSSPTSPVFVPLENRSGESLTVADAQQTGLLNPGGTTSRCGAPMPVPPLVSTDMFRYDAFSITNRVNEPLCVSVAFGPEVGTAGCPSSLTAATYSPAFTGVAQAAVLAQAAFLVGGTGDRRGVYSYDLAPGATAVNVVTSSGAGSVCASYNYVVGTSTPYPTTAPSVTGTAALGSELAASDGVWTGPPVTSRVWRRCDSAGGNCTTIGGATGTTYTPTSGDVGSRLRVRVTASLAGFTSSADSTLTDVVPKPADTSPAPKPDDGGPPSNAGPRPPDRVAPRVTLKLGKNDLAAALKSGIPLTLTCDEACSVTLDLTITPAVSKKVGLGKKVKIATIKRSARAGTATTLKAKLSRAARKKLGKLRSLSVSVSGTAKDATGNARAVKTTVKLKRLKKR